MVFLLASKPHLRQKSSQVPADQITSEYIKGLCDRLLPLAEYEDAAYSWGGTHMGVAAAQIGINRAIVVVKHVASGEWRVLINPRILRQGGETVEWWHRCRSTGQLVTVLGLPRYMEVQYEDQDGITCTWQIDGVSDGAQQLHGAWHQIRHTQGLRHADYAVEHGLPLFIVYGEEREDFLRRIEGGSFLEWPRRLTPAGWRAMKLGRGWVREVVGGETV